MRKNRKSGEEGLSLFEVLVALSLAALLFLSVDLATDSGRSELDSTLESIERAVRFSSDEAVLKGAMVRVHFKLDENPQEITVEAGPLGDFALPSFELFTDTKKLSLADQENKNSLLKSVSKQFNKVSEFQEENIKLPSQIKIVGVSTNLRDNIVEDGEANVYAFPSGEKDSALIILASSKELVSLTIDPFTDTMTREYKTLMAKSGEEILTETESLLKEFHDKWKKK